MVNQIPLIEEFLDKVKNNLNLEQQNPTDLVTLEKNCKLMRDTVRVLRELNVAVAPELAEDDFWDLPGKE